MVITVHGQLEQVMHVAMMTMADHDFRATHEDPSRYVSPARYRTIVKCMAIGSHAGELVSETAREIFPILALIPHGSRWESYTEVFLAVEELDSDIVRLTVIQPHRSSTSSLRPAEAFTIDGMHHLVRVFSDSQALIDGGDIIRASQLPQDSPLATVNLVQMKKASKQARKKR